MASINIDVNEWNDEWVKDDKEHENQVKRKKRL